MSTILQWDELDIHTVTNLFLYGTTETPTHYVDRLRLQAEYNALPTILIEGVLTKVLTIQIDAATFMSEGPGRFLRRLAG